MENIKQKLYNLCRLYVENRISTAHHAIKAAREASEGDSKSSAGDKYETTREMMQQEINRNQIQLADAEGLKNILERISAERKTETVQAGSLVVTDNGTFYISISAGQLSVEGKSYYAVSLSSPVGKTLFGNKTGDLVELNNRVYRILNVQ